MATKKNLPVYTRAEVQKHNKPEDAWIIIDDGVYDVSKFAGLHPGGEKLLLDLAGTDTTADFIGLHRQEVLDKYAPRLKIGTVEGVKASPHESWVDVSSVPFSESFHMRPKWVSPYYTEKHKEFRLAVRKFLHENVRQWADQAEVSHEYPSKELFATLGASGFLACSIGPGEHLKVVPQLLGGVKPEEFDLWMEAIIHEELGRIGAPGATDSLCAGMMISLPVVLHFGFKDKSLRDRVVKEVLMGEKRIVLAVTEPFAGSDVANVRLTATKTADGSGYLLNGVKKWITGGATADYFVTLARTGGPGAGGLSYFLVPRGDGLSTKQITTAYSKSAGTALVFYENVFVPASHLVGGKENVGFAQAMNNFTKERHLIVARMLTVMRSATEECWKWALQRQVFGKPLITQPVIRFKLAEMSARIDAVQAWYELVTYQMTKMSFTEQGVALSGTMCLLKFETTRVASFIADQAPQIFGGRAITGTGMGKIVERYARTFKFASILGGSEEILANQAVQMALRSYNGKGRL